jgi:nucleoside-diphosphate-sugar epimerase
MNILLLGGTGTAGRSTLPVLLAAGHTVSVHVRSDLAAARLQPLGVSAIRFDAEDPEALVSVLRGQDAVIDHRVSLPPTSRSILPGAWRSFQHLRDPALSLLVDAMIHAGVPRLVRDLVTFVYEDGGDAWLDEASPVSASGPMAANLLAEAHVSRLTAAGGQGVVLRCGLFYGPDDRMSVETMRLARRGAALLLGADAAWHSALYTGDVGTAVLAALRVAPGVYNVVDDEPLRRCELAALLAQSAGRRRIHRPPGLMVPLAGAAARVQARSHRISSQRFREATGWRPRVPTRREGWPAAFAAVG